MGDVDDLEAFFDEVSAVEAAAVQESQEDQNSKAENDDVPEPPTKKAKVAAVRPRGVVVAAASTSVVDKPSTETLASPLDHTSTAAPPTAATPSHPPLPPGPPPANKDKTSKANKRMAAGKAWVDNTLSDWPENDYRIFVGNLSRDVTDQMLYQHFEKYPSLAMVKVVRDAKGLSKGYGFVSLMQPMECAQALREMDQTWLSSRPIRVKRSDWKDRDLKQVRKKERQAIKRLKKFGV